MCGRLRLVDDNRTFGEEFIAFLYTTEAVKLMEKMEL